MEKSASFFSRFNHTSTTLLGQQLGQGVQALSARARAFIDKG